LGSYTEFWTSNRAGLYAVGEAVDNEAPYLLAKYRLPAVWLALFDVDDMQVFCDLRNKDGLEVHLAGPRDVASRRLARRSDWLLHRFPSLRPEWLAQFQAWLDGLHDAYVHMSTADVACMTFSLEEWAEELPRILRMFDEPLVAPAAALEPPAPSEGLMRSLARWWHGTARAAAAPKQLTGWDRYSRHFVDRDLTDSPAAWAYLGGNGSDKPVPWDSGD
jgi:hypothetical protein